MGGAAASTSSAALPYVPPADKTPPRIKLLGSGTAAVTTSGAIIMVEEVPWRREWVDAGATAIDAVDGNLTSMVQSFGAGELGTDSTLFARIGMRNCCGVNHINSRALALVLTMRAACIQRFLETNRCNAHCATVVWCAWLLGALQAPLTLAYPPLLTRTSAL
jgi:hypothetical protein